MNANAIQNSLTNLTESFCNDGALRSVILSDIDGGLRIEHNPERLYPPASLTKLLIAETAVDLGLDLMSCVPISDLHATRYPTVINALDSHREVSIGELMALSLVTSDNASADYILHRIGIDKINKRAEELGMSSTKIASGFRDEEFSRGSESTTCASDVAHLLTHIYSKRHFDGYERIWKSLVNNLRNTRIPGLLPDDLAVAHKTGSLEGIAHDAGVLLMPNMPLVLVILTEQESVTLRTSLEIAVYSRAVYDYVAGATSKQR